MPIEYRLTGGAANTNPAASLGGVMSSTVISATELHNLFDKVEVAEREVGDIEYRYVDIYNNSAAPTTVQSLYIETQTSSSETDIAIGIDTVAGSHASNANLELLTNESTAPASVVLSQPVVGSPIACPVLGAYQAIRMAVRWTVAAGSQAIPNDLGKIRFAHLY